MAIKDIVCYHLDSFAIYDKKFYVENYGDNWVAKNYKTVSERTAKYPQLFVDSINSNNHHIGIMIITNSQLKWFAKKQLATTNIMDFLVYQKGPIQNYGYLAQGPVMNLYVFNFPEGNKVVLK